MFEIAVILAAVLLVWGAGKLPVMFERLSRKPQVSAPVKKSVPVGVVKKIAPKKRRRSGKGR